MPLLDSDLLYTGVISGRFYCICKSSFKSKYFSCWSLLSLSANFQLYNDYQTKFQFDIWSDLNHFNHSFTFKIKIFEQVKVYNKL